MQQLNKYLRLFEQALPSNNFAKRTNYFHKTFFKTSSNLKFRILQFSFLLSLSTIHYSFHNHFKNFSSTLFLTNFCGSQLQFFFNESHSICTKSTALYYRLLTVIMINDKKKLTSKLFDAFYGI